MSITKLMQDIDEEFEEKFQTFKQPEKYLTNMDIENGKLICHKDFLHSAQTHLLEEVIKECEGMKQDTRGLSYDDDLFAEGGNRVLSDIISKLNERKSIKI